MGIPTLNKTIAYIALWKHTFLVAGLLGVLLPALLIFLEPFDTSNEFAYKNLRLSGYGLCLALPVLLLHPVENFIYRKQGKRWFVVNELFYIGITFLLMIACCFFYHFYVMSGLTTPNLGSIWNFLKYYGLPFTPILIPLWLYLRSKYGIIEVPVQGEAAFAKAENITLHGENKSEALTIATSDFIYAQSQQNYVAVHYKTEHGIQQEMLRSTLSNMMMQLPNAWQVHRSYLVNLDYLERVEGNARKRFMKITEVAEPIPISQKYYDALKKRLSNSSQ